MWQVRTVKVPHNELEHDDEWADSDNEAYEHLTHGQEIPLTTSQDS